jgi:hypothetical protein
MITVYMNLKVQIDVITSRKYTLTCSLYEGNQVSLGVSFILSKNECVLASCVKFSCKNDD